MAVGFILMAGLSLLACQSLHLSNAVEQLARQPPVYVIQSAPQQSSLPANQWNNQNLRPRPALGNGGVGNQAGLSSRRAKQLIYTDEPMPYYHSYKFMGFGNGVGALDEQHFYSAVLAKHQSGRASASGAGAKSRRRTSSSSSPSFSKQNEVKSGGKRRQYDAPSMPFDQDNDGRNTLDSIGNNRTNNRASNPKKGAKKNLVCYYGTWAVYRPDGGKYPVENIDPFLCTHIIYGFTGLSYDNTIKPLDPWNDLEDNYGKGAMKRFTNLKRLNPDLIVLVAIGGWNEGSIKYSKMASDPEARAKFVSSVVNFLEKFNFDGLDLDWEYPASRGGSSYDKQNFVKLLRELKQAFEPRGYLLTAAVSAGKWYIDPAYDIGQVSKYLDLINLMAYDYHGGWETKTGMNAPLFHSPKHDRTREEQTLNVNWSVNYWLQNGASPEKIMLGVGSYGRSFTLDRADRENGINAPASQKGRAGPYTREPGSLGYNEICEQFKREPKSWTIVRDPDYLAPYAYNGQERQWVGYDDRQSLALKASYAKSMGLGGVMMWSIETDDFNGRCHGEKYPLLKTIRRVLDGQPAVVVDPPDSGSGSGSNSGSTTTSSTTRRPPTGEVEEDRPISTSTAKPHRPTPGSQRPTTARPTRPRPTSPTTSSTTSTRRPISTTSARPGNEQPVAQFQCKADGLFADPANCRKFFRCVSSSFNRYSIYKFDCGPGTAFNEAQQYCDHIYNVPNCAKTSSANRLMQQQYYYYQ